METSWGQGFVGHVQKRRRGQPNDGGALRPALLEPDGLLRRRVGVRNNTARRNTGRRRERRRRRHRVAVVRWAGRRPLAEEPRSPQFARVRQLLVEGRREPRVRARHAGAAICKQSLRKIGLCLEVYAHPTHPFRPLRPRPDASKRRAAALARPARGPRRVPSSRTEETQHNPTTPASPVESSERFPHRACPSAPPLSE